MLVSYFLAQKLSQGHLRLFLEMHSSSPRAAMPPAGSPLPPVATFTVNQILSERITRSPENGCVQVGQIRSVPNTYCTNLFFLCSPCTTTQGFTLQGAQWLDGDSRDCCDNIFTIHWQDKALKLFEASHKEFGSSESTRGRAGVWVWGRAAAAGGGSWQR